MKTNLLLLLLAICSPRILMAQQQVVSAFKDGTGFFNKTLSIQAPESKYILKEIPQATFGTLWFYAPGNQFKSILAQNQELSIQKSVENPLHFLLANEGKRAKIQMKGELGSETGRIEKINSQLLILKSDRGEWLSISPKQVEAVYLLEKPAQDWEQKTKSKVISMEFTRPKASQELEMMYLQKGISWVPNYLIELGPDDKAKITLRASLLNDAEDLKDAEVNFVVGIPNFAYSYLESPLSSSKSLMSFISTLNSRANAQSNQNTRSRRADITRQSFANMASVDMSDEEEPFIPLEGQQNGDLYFYTARGISLAKGGRGLYNVLEAEVDCQHIYEVNLSSNSTRGGYSQMYRFEANAQKNLVYHSIRLSNLSKMPWTTGTALLVDREKGETLPKPISQDKLDYVPPGGKGKLKITVAPNVSVQDSEKELSRETITKRKEDATYDLIQVEAKIRVRNYQDKDLKVNINRSVSGEMKSCTQDWKVEKLFNAQSAINPRNQIEWEVELKAGKTEEITYTYQVYIRR